MSLVSMTNASMPLSVSVISFVDTISYLALRWRWKYTMVKKGAKYKCESCGVVMVVDRGCGCTPCDLICCGAPMKEIKTKAKPKAKK